MSLYNDIVYASPPPEGITPDKDAPPESNSLLAIPGIFLPLATATVGIRIYTRSTILGKVMMDDYLMMVAMVLGVIMSALVLDMLNYGLGKHLWDIPLEPDLYPKWMIRNVIAAIMFCAATGLAKGSILLFYLRIFPSKTMKWATWSVFGFVFGYSAASVFVNVFSCNPIAGSWELQKSLSAVCINWPAFYFFQAGLGIVVDVATVIVPLPMLRTLHVPRKQKIFIAFILTLGTFVCVISCIRLQSLYRLLTDADLTVNTVPALMSCILELNLSIIGGSIPALKPFALRFFPRLLGSTHDNNRKTPNSMIYAPYSSAKRHCRSAGYMRHAAPESKAAKEEEHIRPATSDAGSEDFIIMQPTDIVKTVRYGYSVRRKESLDMSQ